MANLLIRNLPLTQEAIRAVEKGLAGAAESVPRPLPEPVKPRRPITMEETLSLIDEGQR